MYLFPLGGSGRRKPYSGIYLHSSKHYLWSAPAGRADRRSFSSSHCRALFWRSSAAGHRTGKKSTPRQCRASLHVAGSHILIARAGEKGYNNKNVSLKTWQKITLELTLFNGSSATNHFLRELFHGLLFGTTRKSSRENRICF